MGRWRRTYAIPALMADIKRLLEAVLLATAYGLMGLTASFGIAAAPRTAVPRLPLATPPPLSSAPPPCPPSWTSLPSGTHACSTWQPSAIASGVGSDQTVWD